MAGERNGQPGSRIGSRRKKLLHTSSPLVSQQNLIKEKYNQIKEMEYGDVLRQIDEELDRIRTIEDRYEGGDSVSGYALEALSPEEIRVRRQVFQRRKTDIENAMLNMKAYMKYASPKALVDEQPGGGGFFVHGYVPEEKEAEYLEKVKGLYNAVFDKYGQTCSRLLDLDRLLSKKQEEEIRSAGQSVPETPPSEGNAFAEMGGSGDIPEPALSPASPSGGDGGNMFAGTGTPGFPDSGSETPEAAAAAGQQIVGASGILERVRQGRKNIENTSPSVNFRRVSYDENQKEQFDDLAALDIAIKTSAEHAGIKRERPDISLIADGSVGVGVFNGREYVQRSFSEAPETFSVNSVHMTPTIGLRPYIPKPRITPDEERALEEKYDVAGLRGRIRDIMLGYKVDEYQGISMNMDSRQAALRASERMIMAVNELTTSSSMFQAIHSADPEERIWAQKAMIEIFESAGNEYEYHVNNLIDRLDPVLLQKKAKDLENYSREMKSLGEQGIRQTTDPSNMFAIFVLMHFCPAFAIALVVPMLLPNLLSWGAHGMSERAVFGAKDAEALRIQEKSGAMSAKVMGNMILSRIVPTLANGVSPEELSRFVDSIKDNMRGFGSKLQSEIAKSLAEITKLTEDGRTIVRGSAAYQKAEELFKGLSVEVAKTMLDITEDGSIGVSVERMKAVRDVAEASEGSRLFEIDGDVSDSVYCIKTRPADAENPPLFTPGSVMSKSLTENVMSDARKYAENLGVIQDTMLMRNENIRNKYKAQKKVLERELEGTMSPEKRAETEEKLKGLTELLDGMYAFEDMVKDNPDLAFVSRRPAGYREDLPEIRALSDGDSGERNFSEIERFGFKNQSAHSDAVAGMLMLRKPDGQINPNSAFHYTRYGFARDEMGVRVGKNVDVKLPTVFSSFKAMQDAVRGEREVVGVIRGEFDKSVAELERNTRTTEKMCSLFGTVGKDELFEKMKNAHSGEFLSLLRAEKDDIRNIIGEIDNNARTADSDRERNLWEKVGAAVRAVQDLAADGVDNETKEMNIAVLSGEIVKNMEELHSGAKERYESACRGVVAQRSKGDDLLGAWMADMSMRIVPQEAWGGVYSLDDKFLIAREKGAQREERFLQSIGGSDGGKTRAMLESVRIASEKMHEANKLSLVAFIISRQIQAEREKRKAAGIKEPGFAEIMAASTMAGMLADAAALELEAAPVLASASALVLDVQKGNKKELSGTPLEGLSQPQAAEVCGLIASCVNDTASITGGGLLAERIAEAGEKLGYDIREMSCSYSEYLAGNSSGERGTSEQTGATLRRVLDSGMLSGSIYVSGDGKVRWNEWIDPKGPAVDLTGGADVREVFAKETRNLYKMKKGCDFAANRELRKLVDVESKDRGRWNDTISLLTSWCNETSMSGLLSKLIGTHVDADVANAFRVLAGRDYSIGDGRQIEKEQKGFLDVILGGFKNVAGIFDLGTRESGDRTVSVGVAPEEPPVSQDDGIFAGWFGGR